MTPTGRDDVIGIAGTRTRPDVRARRTVRRLAAATLGLGFAMSFGVPSVAGAATSERFGTHPSSDASTASSATYSCGIKGIISDVSATVQATADAPATATSDAAVSLSDATLSVELTLSGGIVPGSASVTLGPAGSLSFGSPSILAPPVSYSGGLGTATVTGDVGSVVPITVEQVAISSNVGTVVCVPVTAAVVVAEVAIVADTVTYVARYDDRQCAAIGRVADALGISPADVVRLGVNGFRAIADAGEATPGNGVAPNEGPCEIEVSWPADEAAAITEAADAWGVDTGQLQRGGGWLVVVLIYLASVGQN